MVAPDLTIIIGIVTLVLVIFTVVWGTGLWARRERAKIKTRGLHFQFRLGDRIVFKLNSTELQRSGNKELRSVKRILLRLDKSLHDELSQYIDFSQSRELILTGRQGNLRKDEIRTVENWTDYEYKILDGSAWDKAKEKIVEQLHQATFEVGLIWEDNPSKTQWVRITPEDFDKWREV